MNIVRDDRVEKGGIQGAQYGCKNVYGRLTRLGIIALSMTDVPKKNKKGKRVA